MIPHYIGELLTDLYNLIYVRALEGARVAVKVNAKGNLILALVVPPRRPGQWKFVEEAYEKWEIQRREERPIR